MIPFTDPSTGYIKTKITKITDLKNQQKNYIVLVSLSWIVKFGEAGMAKNIDETKDKINSLLFISHLTIF